MAETGIIHNRRDLVKSKSTRDTYRTLCNLLDNHRKVYYSRFGDGDLFIIMGRGEENHEYSESLAAELRESLCTEHPQFLRGLQVNYPHEKLMTKGFFERHYYNDEMQDYIIDNLTLSFPAVFESGVFSNYYAAVKPGEMSRFLDKYIRPKKKMIIGSVPEAELRKLFGDIQYYVSIPVQNAYAEIDSWWPEVLKNIDSVDVVLPAAGMATRVICKRLWDSGREVHVIDLGSVVDAVSSLPPTRKWIKLRRHMLKRILLPEYRDNSLSYWVTYAVEETGFICRYLYYRMDPLFNLPVFPKAKRHKKGNFRQS